MADEAYVYTSNKDEWDSTNEVVAARDDNGEPTKVLVRGGQAVFLTEEERERVSQRFNIRKASERQVEQAVQVAPEQAPDEAVAANTNDNTSVAPDADAAQATSGPRSRR